MNSRFLLGSAAIAGAITSGVAAFGPDDLPVTIAQLKAAKLAGTIIRGGDEYQHLFQNIDGVQVVQQSTSGGVKCFMISPVVRDLVDEAVLKDSPQIDKNGSVLLGQEVDLINCGY